MVTGLLYRDPDRPSLVFDEFSYFAGFAKEGSMILRCVRDGRLTTSEANELRIGGQPGLCECGAALLREDVPLLLPVSQVPGACAQTIVRTVLGQRRMADVMLGDPRYPWVTCPFCSSAFYLAEAPPEHAKSVTVGTQGRCANPWCEANPNMPLDAARLARGQEHLRWMEYEERERNHRAAIERLRLDREAQRERMQANIDRAKAEGFCTYCAAKGKFVRHRMIGGCPAQMRGRR
jgi:hypothetical protein